MNTTITYRVNFQYYQHNDGRANNGWVNHYKDFADQNEALQFYKYAKNCLENNRDVTQEEKEQEVVEWGATDLISDFAYKYAPTDSGYLTAIYGIDKVTTTTEKI